MVVLATVVTLGVFALGWTVGRAQGRVGDFELRVEGEVGTTRIECVRGCTLQGERDLSLTTKPPAPVYTFACSGRGVQSCRAVVHGFLPR